MAEHNEKEEHDVVYKEFEQVAKEEGFDDVARAFFMIGRVEKYHAERFAMFKNWLKENQLFVSDVSTTKSGS